MLRFTRETKSQNNENFISDRNFKKKHKTLQPSQFSNISLIMSFGPTPKSNSRGGTPKHFGPSARSIRKRVIKAGWGIDDFENLGQAHDMFSQIFLMGIYEYFSYKILRIF